MGKRERTFLEYKTTEIIDGLADGELKEQAIKAREFGNMLGRIIQDKGLKKNDVCERAEVEYRDLQRYLDGKQPGQRAVIRLAMALEQPLDEANRLLRSANCGMIHSTNAEMRIIKKYYNMVIEELELHRDNPEYVCESIIKLNEELKNRDFHELFKSSGKGRVSKYD